MDLAQARDYYEYYDHYYNYTRSLDVMDIQGKITRDGEPVTGTIRAYLVDSHEESSHHPVGDIIGGSFEISFINGNNHCTTVKYDYSDPEVDRVIEQGYGYVNLSSGEVSSDYGGPLWATFKLESYSSDYYEGDYEYDTGKWIITREGYVAGECEDGEECCGRVVAKLEKDTGVNSYTTIDYVGHCYNYSNNDYDHGCYASYNPDVVGQARIIEDGTCFLHVYRTEWMKNVDADRVVLAVEENNGKVSIISGLHENDSDYFIKYQPQLENVDGQAFSYEIDLADQVHAIPVNRLTSFGLPVNKQYYTGDANPIEAPYQTKVDGMLPAEIQVENMSYFPVWDYDADRPGLARNYVHNVIGLDYRGFSAGGSLSQLDYLGPGYGYAVFGNYYYYDNNYYDRDAKIFFHGDGVGAYKTPLVNNENNNGWTFVSVAGETGESWKIGNAGDGIAKDGTKPDYIICFDHDINAYSISFAGQDVTFYGVQAGDLELWLNGVNLGDIKDYPYACFYHVPKN